MSAHPWLFALFAEWVVCFVLTFIGEQEFGFISRCLGALLVAALMLGPVYLVLAAAGALR